MSKAARRFVDQWISDNVEATGEDPGVSTAMAHELATKCLAAANQADIDRAAIEVDCGDLVAYIDAAIARANEEEAKRLIGRVREDPSA
jgi:hypothetical protein